MSHGVVPAWTVSFYRGEVTGRLHATERMVNIAESEKRLCWLAARMNSRTTHDGTRNPFVGAA